MRRDITQALFRWISAGFSQIGQIEIRTTDSWYELYHVEDRGKPDLETFTPDQARFLATYDDAGNYRPLRSAPNLRHGWRMLLPDIAAIRAALDHFYPSMLGVLLSHESGALAAVPFRSTLERQTGMYAVTKKVTDDNAQAMIGRFCTSDGGCLKTILWPLSPGLPITTLPAEKFDVSVNQSGTSQKCLPLLCHEACNLLVAETRAVVKKLQAQPQKAADNS